MVVAGSINVVTSVVDDVVCVAVLVVFDMTDELAVDVGAEDELFSFAGIVEEDKVVILDVIVDCCELLDFCSSVVVTAEASVVTVVGDWVVTEVTTTGGTVLDVGTVVEHAGSVRITSARIIKFPCTRVSQHSTQGPSVVVDSLSVVVGVTELDENTELSDVTVFVEYSELIVNEVKVCDELSGGTGEISDVKITVAVVTSGVLVGTEGVFVNMLRCVDDSSVCVVISVGNSVDIVGKFVNVGGIKVLYSERFSLVGSTVNVIVNTV